MVKTGSVKRFFAVLLSVLLAASALGVTSFAEDEPVFRYLTVYTDTLDEGGIWYNCRALADATGISVYRYDSKYYISADNNIIKIEYKVDDVPTTELRYRDKDAQYFEFLCVVPAFGEALPTSPDGLADGAYWFDQAGLIEAVGAFIPESNMYMFTDATFHLSVDGTILRRTYMTPYGFTSNSDEFVIDNPGIACSFLRKAGVDPNEGFSLLPTSAEGLPDGTYWFDLETFANLFSGDTKTYILAASYYLSNDGQTLRMIIAGNVNDFSKSNEDDSFYFNYLRQAGVDPVSELTLLPTSPDGLNNGDYWYDADGLAEEDGSEELKAAQYYLSADGQTISISFGGYSVDVKNDGSSVAEMVFAFLHQVGEVEAEHTVVFSAEDVQCSGYYFDLDSYIDFSVERENADLISHGDSPMSEEEEAKYRAVIREEIEPYSFRYNPSMGKLKLSAGSDSVTLTQDSELYQELVSFIIFYESDNHDWDDGEVTTEPTATQTGLKVYTCRRCGATKEEILPQVKPDVQDVLWAGYGSALDDVTLDAGEKPAASDGTIYVIAKAGASKIQIRDAAHTGTLTYHDTIGQSIARHPSVKDVISVTYEGRACDLWVIRKELLANDYIAVAKYSSAQPIARIPDESGCTFSVQEDPAYNTAVYSASVDGVDPAFGYIPFNARTPQTITITTGADVEKILLVAANGTTLTYNRNTAKRVEAVEQNGRTVLVWTITRLFQKGDYDYAIRTRSVLGLQDSGKTMTFTVAAA